MSVATDLASVVASVVDPEIPVLTIEDLGVLRSVATEDGHVVVTITPTYSGCPAMRQIEDDIGSALVREGVESFEVRVSHNPVWTTEWISDDGHRKLSEFGIAPPTEPAEVLCPRCEADRPRMVARFGSTACKALMVCSSCGEPFNYFKQF
ncbi:MAG: 1,2-phenylacetyl-CoA epoxidase subunit PaaD [Acidimicrobiia bacterium]